jgi:hypothetical protein
MNLVQNNFISVYITQVFYFVSLGLQIQIVVTKVGWNFIQLNWNSVSSYYGNVEYSIHYISNNRGDKITTNHEQATIKNLQQYTTYSLQVQAIVNGIALVSSTWISNKTAGKRGGEGRGGEGRGGEGRREETRGEETSGEETRREETRGDERRREET